jgi:hypothetical protein
MKVKLLLVLFGILLGALALEGALRILDWSKREKGVEFQNIDDFRNALTDPQSASMRIDGVTFASIVRSHPNDRIIYELKPNLNVKFTGVQVTTNSFGMRGPEVEPAKPPGTYRIALLGDSFAFGWGLEQNQTFAQVMEDRLNEFYRGKRKFQVLNFGVPGYSTFQEAAAFQEKGYQFSPDAVVVFFIDNDFDFPFFVRDVGQPGGLVQSFALGRFTAKVLHPSLEQTKMAMQGLDPNSSLAILDNETAPKGIKLFLAINPRKGWRSCVQRLPIIRTSQTLGFMNLAPDFKRIVTENNYTDVQLNLPHDLHPSALRARIYGELMAPYLQRQIGE